jgi:glutamyl-tRNA synthetase
MTIRTRFAPSPTGYLHIGGVRTALFNWLLTRRLGGQFILRIDDTDQDRNRPEALQPILDGFRWLGIDWDEGPEVGGPYGPYYQSQRGELYRKAALELVDRGHAYPDYTTAEERKAAREKAGKGYIHRGQHRNTPPDEARRLYNERPTALCLKMPAGRTVAIEDQIRGHVGWQTDTLSDPVILRADGSPLYNFATVVDDVAMKITHVIRAAEHLDNTAVQVLVYEGLGYPTPVFAHVPVVNAPNSNEKLSKRKMQQFMTPEVIAQLRDCHVFGPECTDEQIRKQEGINPATVAFYRERGYLPAALVNYLGRLGWSLDDKEEIIPLERMIANFGLERVNKSPASFDPVKLDWLAGEYMRMLPEPEKVAGVIPFLQRRGLTPDGPPDEAARRKVAEVVRACGDRLKLFSDILLYGSFFFTKDPEYDMQAVKKRVQKAGVPEALHEFAKVLADVQPFEPDKLEEALEAFCEGRGMKVGDMNHALRVATTGVMIGPGVYECLAILGREETLRRIELALALK